MIDSFRCDAIASPSFASLFCKRKIKIVDTRLVGMVTPDMTIAHLLLLQSAITCGGGSRASLIVRILRYEIEKKD